eukprot:4581689-Prymnesium_polylepis.1
MSGSPDLATVPTTGGRGTSWVLYYIVVLHTTHYTMVYLTLGTAHLVMHAHCFRRASLPPAATTATRGRHEPGGRAKRSAEPAGVEQQGGRSAATVAEAQQHPARPPGVSSSDVASNAEKALALLLYAGLITIVWEVPGSYSHTLGWLLRKLFGDFFDS